MGETMTFTANKRHWNLINAMHVTVLLLLISSISAQCQYAPQFGSEGWDVGFDGERALRHVYVLASDSMRGRYSGFAGSEKADRYIVDHYRRLGLEPPFGEDGYFHNFTYGAGEYTMPSSFKATFLDGRVKEAYMWQEYNTYKYSGFGKVSGRLVFLGYGISVPEKGWDEYKGIDVKGAVVLAMRGTPDIRGIEWKDESSSGFKSTTALERGAVGFLMVDGDPPKLATITERYYRENLPAMWISRSLADSLLHSTRESVENFRKIISETSQPVSQELDVSIEMEVSGTYYPERPTRNIAALLPGCDESLQHEVIVIGAHMDHHGVDAAGNIYPGADDNASGTAAVMELAYLFCNIRHSYKRSILFMGFAAEEEGLVGSRKFVESLPLGDYTIVAMLNMDMVGQGDGNVGIAGLPESPLLGDIMFGYSPSVVWEDETMESLAFWGLYPGSDHASFYRHGIPSYAIGARGSHPNYHTPCDTAGAIKPEIIKVVGETTFHCASALADYPYFLTEYATKEQALLRANAGIVFESIMTGQDSPLWSLKWVDYPDPIMFVTFPNDPYANQDSRLSRVMTTLERARQHIKDGSTPFLADSMRSDYKGELFRGASVILPSIEYLPDDYEAVRSLARLGVGFVDVTGLTCLNGRRLKDSELDRHIAEPAYLCRKAGIRPIMRDKYPDEIVRIADKWGNQLICCIDPRDVDLKQAERLVKTGCFILFEPSDSASDASIIKQLYSSKIGNRIGIVNRETTACMIANLLGLDLNDDDIECLLIKNLQKTLIEWWSDSYFSQVEL